MSERRRKWSKYRALAWEQLVVTASICAAALAVHVFQIAMAWLLLRERGILAADAADLVAGGVLALSIAAVTSVVRQNVLGELAFDFDPRLRRMPLRTFPLVVLLYGLRTGCMFLFVGLLILSHRALFGAWPNTDNHVLLLGLYLLLQTLVWTRQSITGIEYAVPAVLFLLLLGAAVASIEPTQQSQGFDLNGDKFSDIVWTCITPATLALLYLACFGFSLAGIALLRRDARWGLPKPAELHDALAGLSGAPDRPFRSALAAQIWFERQRGARWLPVFWLIVLPLYLVVFMLQSEMRRGFSGYQWLPYAALFLCAPVAGAITLAVGAGPWFTRPLETRQLALAKLIALFQVFVFTLVLASVLSTILYFVMNPNTLQLVMVSWAENETDLRFLAAWLAGPLVVSALAGWLLLFLRQWEWFVIAAAAAALYIYGNALGFVEWNNGPRRGDAMLPILLLVVIVVPFAFYWRALRKGLLPFIALEAAVAVVAVCGVFFFFYSGVFLPSADMLWYGLAAGSLAVFPGATLTLRLARLRHR